MARYRVQGPDGKVYVFEGPDGASPAEVEAFAAQQFGNPKARPQAPEPTRYDPSAGGGTLQFGPIDTGIATPLVVDRLASGAGSGIASVLRAVGGGRLAAAMGLPDTKEEAEALDKPLTDTTAGTVGRVIGQAAPAALAIPFTPVAAGVAGNAAIGAGVGAATGALMTEGDLGDRAAGAAGGFVGGAAAPLLAPVARTVRGAWRGLTEPLTAGGRDRIAGRAIRRFATNPDALDTLAAGRTITGAQPTLAEATRDEGIAGLQRAVSTLDPDAAAALAGRERANNAERVATLRAIAGEPGAELPAASSVRALRRIQQGPSRASAEGTRSAQARVTYGDAFAQGIDQDAAAVVQPQLDELLARPSVQRAMAQARDLAREEGLAIGDEGSVAGMHYAKQALDDMVQTATRSGDMNRARLIGDTAANLSTVLDEIAPAYQQARAAYRQLSVPVNRQDVAARLLESATPERDLLGNRTLRAGPFARALNDEARLIEQSTGFGGAGASLDDLMTATQSQRIQAVRDELETLAALDKAANGKGSQTAKMLASQNLLRQVAGPLGVPDSWLEGVVAQTALRPLAFGARAAEERVAGRVADAMLDPGTASALVRGAQAFDTPRAMSPLEVQLRALLGRTAPAAAGGLSAYGASQ